MILNMAGSSAESPYRNRPTDMELRLGYWDSDRVLRWDSCRTTSSQEEVLSSISMSTTTPTRKQLRVKRMFVAPASRTPSAPLLSMQESPRTGMEVLELDDARAVESRMFQIRPLQEQSPTRPISILKKQTNDKSRSRHEEETMISPSITTSTEAEPKKTPPRLQPSSKDSRKKERPFTVPVRKKQQGRTSASPSPSPTIPNSPRDQQLRQHDSPSQHIKPPVVVGMSIQERVKLLQQTAGVVDSVAGPAAVPQSPRTSSTTSSPTPFHRAPPSPRSLSVPSPKRSQQDNDSASTNLTPKLPPSASNTISSAPVEANLKPAPSTPPRSSTKHEEQPNEDSRDTDDEILTAVGVADESVSTMQAPRTPEQSSRTKTSPSHMTPPSSNTPIKTNRRNIQIPPMDHPESSMPTVQRPQPPYELTRPFERPIPDNDSWIVQVSDAEWDGDNQKWKYRILVQRRHTMNESDNASLTKAFCWRTIPDFFWLERALINEYHGGLLIPVLSIALGSSETVAAEMPVEPELLKDWLSDIMNGCRGNGEWTVPTPSDLIESESMGSFLYKHSLQSDHRLPRKPAGSSAPPELRAIPAFAQCSDRLADDTSPCASPQKTFVDSLNAILSFDFCAGPMPTSNRSDRVYDRNHNRRTTTKVPGINCESKALGSATDFSVQDSMVETASTISAMTLKPTSKVGHSQLLAAERDLAASYRFTALSALERLQNLIHHEERVALGWKGFAEAMSSLFAYEAKVDLSDIKVRHMPYRKLTPDALKECMDEFVQRKTERSVPALRHLQDLVSSYIGDLSAVEPAMKSYDTAVEQVRSFPDAESIAESEDSDGRWTQGGPGTDSKQFPGRSAKASTAILSSDEALYQRLLVNEGILRQSLTTFFRTSTLRRIRMAWAFYKSEIRQCADLQTTASALRKELNIVSSSAVSKLLKRHAKEEKEDHSTEQALLQRMVHLGHAQRFAYDSGTESSATSICNELIEVDNDDLSEERSKAIKRDKALELARQRIGHWDASLAMAVMEAVAVEDPNVRVDETSKDLRAVRKYAMGLKEKLNKCVELLNHLRQSTERNPLKASRQMFVNEISVVLSGAFVEGENLPRRSSTSKSVLYHAGIDTTDTLGWMSAKRSPSKDNTQTCQGDWLLQYLQTRDAQLEWLLSSLSDLLQDYYHRVEVVEGYVYMECVGIQLEKSFNLRRTKTLAAFEKKADLIAAITVATKKKKPKVVKEIAEKLKKLDVSNTNVKESKEAHLESKAVKADLHTLAIRRLTRARELSTERATSILSMWAKEEELNATAEIKVLGNSITSLEDSFRKSIHMYQR